MKHLDKLWVKPSQFTLGFNKEVQQVFSWQTYFDTWKLIDEGIGKVEEMPLFHAFVWYFSHKDKKRLELEKQILNLGTLNPVDISAEWTKRHIMLYRSIKQRGYRPELRKKPITVEVLDDGSLWLKDGTHTVSILLYLKHDAPIEAVVGKRSEKWLKLKDKLRGFYHKKLLYQPSDHPDFADWEVDRECVDRWGVIEKAVDFKDKLVLDVGSNTGFFSFRAAEKGATVVGVEPNEARVEASKAFATFNGLPSSNPTFVEAKFEDYLRRYKNPKFDIVLMLSLLHHYIRRSPEEAWGTVNLLSRCCRNMVLELGVNNLPIEWNPQLILDNSSYSKYEILYEGTRPIYLFSL